MVLLSALYAFTAEQDDAGASRRYGRPSKYCELFAIPRFMRLPFGKQRFNGIWISRQQQLSQKQAASTGTFGSTQTEVEYARLDVRGIRREVAHADSLKKRISTPL